MSAGFDLTQKWRMQQAPVCARYECDLPHTGLPLPMDRRRPAADVWCEVYNDAPKLVALHRYFADRCRSDPVLVSEQTTAG